MSVGAGSIKRAAKTAEDKTEAKAAKPAEDKTAEAVKQKKAEGKAASPKPAANSSVAYGIGQELPIHLM